MDNKQFLLDSFYSELCHTTWLVEKDSVFAAAYLELLTHIENCVNLSNDELELLIDKLIALETLYDERVRDSASWVVPKKQATNELTHDESGKLTEESIELLQTAISDKAGKKTLISDTGKSISFGERWHSMLQDCVFKSVAVNRLTDFISKFIEADGWAKYFVGNIGKNNKRLIQEYHPMDKYNLDHNTNYAAMHLGGDTTKCVLVSVDTASSDGRGEPNSIKFLEIGAHTIIDRFIVGSFKHATVKPITEATAEELAMLLDIN